MKRMLAVALCAVFAGCATYRVQVQTLRTQPASGSPRTCFIESDPSQPSSPQYAEALRCLRTALAHRGYTSAGRPDDATVHVSLRYAVQDVGSEQWHRSMSRDVIRHPSIVSSTNQRVEPGPPTREVTLVPQSERRYLIALSIEAKDARSRQTMWRVDTSAIIGAADRNAILPCLIAAAEPALDPPSDAAADVQIAQGSAKVNALRRGT